MKLVHAAAFSAATLAVAALLGPAAHALSSAAPEDVTYSFAVIGDVPYNNQLKAHLPVFIEGINQDPQVQMAVHLGDIKLDKADCSDAYFDDIRADFDLFTDPLVYAPGDNEWSDCHLVGARNPLERLAAVRRVFFDNPGFTLGSPVAVTSQASLGFPENVRFSQANVSFAALHVVGSNNDLARWSGLGNSAATAAQKTEQQQRMSATIANVRAAFAQATSAGNRAVVLMQQADMFNPIPKSPNYGAYSAFKPLVQAIIDEATKYGGPVYLFDGDSHVFHQDQPLVVGSKWRTFYGVHGSAANVYRITVDGASLGEKDWLKVTVHSVGSPVLTVQGVAGQ